VFGAISGQMVAAILPELGLLVLGVLVLIFDVLWEDGNRGNLGWLTAGGLLLITAVSLTAGAPPEGSAVLWGGTLQHDWLGMIFRVIFMLGAGVTALMAMSFPFGKKGEFYLLMLTSTLGMNLVASAADLVLLYLAFETASIPLYVLAGFMKEEGSVEAGIKYFLFGAMSSALMLFGFSVLYGFSGETNLLALAQAVQGGTISTAVVGVSLLFVLIGFSFKMAAFPLHFWAPDVYQGAPTPISGFLSTASKAAGFSVLLRVLYLSFPTFQEHWQLVLAVISALTMTTGNVIALVQKDLKRLLAYSSIAHAGYVLVGVASASPLGTGSALFYLGVYLLTNLAAFGALTIVGEEKQAFLINDFDGLSRRSPWMGIAMLVSFLSLAGMPPFGGFIAKVLVFAAAVKSDLVWLVFVGALNSIIGLYYYLIVLKHIYLYRSAQEKEPLSVSAPATMALVGLSAGILLAGTLFTPWYNWALNAVQMLF